MVRIKERYLLVNILYPRDIASSKNNAPGNDNVPDFVAVRRATQNELTPQLLARGIKAEVAVLFGDCGAGAVERSLSVKYLSKATSTAILRITREQLRYVWAALTCMRHVPIRNGQPCIFRVARVSGTIRKVEEEAIRQARLLMLATQEHMAGRTTAAFDMLTRAAKDPIAAAAVADDEDGDGEGDDGEDGEDGEEGNGEDTLFDEDDS